MPNEINVVSQTQLIVVEPASQSVSVINAGPQGPAGPPGEGGGGVLPDIVGGMHVTDITPETQIIGGIHVTDL